MIPIDKRNEEGFDLPMPLSQSRPLHVATEARQPPHVHVFDHKRPSSIGENKQTRQMRGLGRLLQHERSKMSNEHYKQFYWIRLVLPPESIAGGNIQNSPRLCGGSPCLT